MVRIDSIATPTRFEKVEQDMTDDGRFQKVKIYVAYTGENLNNSVFSEEVLLDAAKTLPYVPILGYIKADGKDEDFGGHEKQYKLNEDGTVKIEFNTKAYGFVAEDNDAHMETSGGKDWLVCYGYLWTRFTDSIDIFDESGGTKGHSMEIIDADAYVDSEGRVVFTKAKFSGLCILGDGATPAMTGSTISTNFSNDKIQNDIREMIKEFTKEKGVELMSAKDLNKDVDNKENEVVDNEVGNEEESENTTEVTSEEETAKNKDKVEDNNKENEDEDSKKGDKEKDKKNEKSQFELSFEDTRNKLYAVLNDNSSDLYYSIFETFDGYFMCALYDWDSDADTRYFKINYSISDNEEVTVDLQNKVEVFPIYATKEEKDNIENNRTKVTELQEELANLQAYQRGEEMSLKEEMLNKVEERLGNEQINRIKGQFEKLTPKEVEKEIAYAIFQNEKDAKKEGATVFTRNNVVEQKGKYGPEVDKYFVKK
ncbi:hypothetical protein [Liquorilactobacillus hordei]|uniref:Uncharacterized protein n=2 Tax=Liquorilactobacillus hordei TaxID=468911 RepID=A0A0R1MIT9_9LACO|nr:hypothetical protein [Liquorilactobacillus hordei]KRL07919.1 hypothetical protein FC92_GL000986 [Liquorilactobacillus hordei DSM 19519]QYH51134.1 hypothetical protein G6O70_00825 [Liquorilactobacillus hordei DSM 19519]